MSEVRPEEFIEAAGKAGFGRVGLFARSARDGPLDYPVIGNADQLQKILDACEKFNVGVLDCEAFVLTPNLPEEEIDPYLEIAVQLGANHVSCIGNEITREGDRSATGKHTENLAFLAERAAAFGIKVGVEFMRYRDIATLEEAHDLVRAVNAQNVGLVIDAFHLARGGYTASDLAEIDPVHFVHFQICDGLAEIPPFEKLRDEARTKRMHIGDGVLPNAELMELIPDNVPIAFEVPVKADAHLSPNERAVRVAENAKRFLEKLAC